MKARVSALVAGIGLCAFLLATGVSADAKSSAAEAKIADQAKTAELLIAMVRIGRTIVSEHQALINDAAKGNKGFTDDFVGRKIIERFLTETRIDLSSPIGHSQSDILIAMLQSEREVVFNAQPAINKHGIGFKGFSPSVFVRKVGHKFFSKTGIGVKLTGMDYRFPGNQPDDFEGEVLRMFADPRHPKGQRYAKVTVVNGKQVLRVMDPEYADTTCLACHGIPKGEWDMTGMKKEGWNEGGLAGAMSVVMPMR
jgi:hypothetical protein